MSRVFIIQASQDRFNFEAAKRFGELVHVLDENDSIFRLDDSIVKLTQRMSSFTKDDYLLPIGNPGLIGIATALASDSTEGKFSMLQWLGREKEYIPIRVSLWN
tara:strand:+ start:2514 stop:2825 length:312 start_codon:yes stop_codon:yes gene_type:complete